jgi:hypothetical protein
LELNLGDFLGDVLVGDDPPLLLFEGVAFGSDLIGDDRLFFLVKMSGSDLMGDGRLLPLVGVFGSDLTGDDRLLLSGEDLAGKVVVNKLSKFSCVLGLPGFLSIVSSSLATWHFSSHFVSSGRRLFKLLATLPGLVLSSTLYFPLTCSLDRFGNSSEIMAKSVPHIDSASWNKSVS